MKYYLSLLLFFLPKLGFSYAQFIAHGYTNCATCHHNPVGGGPLNNYGRALGANTISDRVLIPRSVSEDKLASYSGFFFRENKSPVQPYGNYRGLYLTRDFTKKNSKSEYIHMEAKLGAVVLLGDKKQWILNGSISYNPDSQANRITGKKYRSREYYLGYRSQEKWAFYMGLLDKPFGLRVPDHTAYSKALNGLAQDDQSHGALFSIINNQWSFNAFAFMGNMTQKAGVRQKGASIRAEYFWGDSFVLGGSFLTSSSSFLEQSLASLHTKFSPSKHSSIMGEIGFGTKKGKGRKENDDKNTFFFSQHHLRIKRGLYYFTTLEYYKSQLNKDASNVRFGPGLQYFPLQKVELRFEIQNARSFSTKNVTEDSWLFLGQVHIWL